MQILYSVFQALGRHQGRSYVIYAAMLVLCTVHEQGVDVVLRSGLQLLRYARTANERG
jgi:hypothetical protein